MPSKEPKDVSDDLIVKGDVIRNLFNPSMAKSTFHDQVNAGKVTKARKLHGYYMLNATRVNLGLPEIDIDEFRKAQEKPSKERALLMAAIIEIIPQTVSAVFDNEPLPGTLTSLELEKVLRYIEVHQKGLSEINTHSGQIHYIRGAFDAIDMEAKD